MGHVNLRVITGTPLAAWPSSTLLYEGPVFHVAISAFTCELWAVLVAFLDAKNPL